MQVIIQSFIIFYRFPLDYTSFDDFDRIYLKICKFPVNYQFFHQILPEKRSSTCNLQASYPLKPQSRIFPHRQTQLIQFCDMSVHNIHQFIDPAHFIYSLKSCCNGSDPGKKTDVRLKNAKRPFSE